jgi:rod shape-determining protein MreC
MKNFFLFVRRFFNGIFFLVLQALCFALIARTRSMQGSDVLSSANAVSAAFYKRQQATTHYFGLATANDSLTAENAWLRAQLAALRHEVDTLNDSVATITRVDSSSTSVTDTGSARMRTIRYARYTFRTALVVNNSVSARNNYITLARGEKDGVRVGMAVLSPSGVVGKVVNTSANFSTAISILSARQPVSGRLADGTTGTVTWEGNPDILLMEAVPQEIKVHRGDTVWTTAFSFAPPDVPIGTVQRIRKVKKNASQTLLLRPTSPFRNLRHVYVVENAMLEERQRLEDSTAAQVRTQERRR